MNRRRIFARLDLETVGYVGRHISCVTSAMKASRGRTAVLALLLAVSAAGHGHGSRTSGGGITYSNDYHPNPVSIVRVDRLVLQAAHAADSSSSDGGSVSLWAEPCNFSTTGAWTTLSWSGVPNPDVGDFIGPSIPTAQIERACTPLVESIYICNVASCPL